MLRSKLNWAHGAGVHSEADHRRCFVRLPAVPPTAFGWTLYSLLGSSHTFCEFQTETQKQCQIFVEVFWSHRAWTMLSHPAETWNPSPYHDKLQWNRLQKPHSQRKFLEQGLQQVVQAKGLYGYPFARTFSCCCTKQCFEFLEQLSWTNSYLMHLAKGVRKGVWG